MTYTEALNTILCQIEHSADASLLTVTLRRLAVLTANREDGPELLEGFCDAYYGKLSDLRWKRQLEAVMRGRN